MQIRAVSSSRLKHVLVNTERASNPSRIDNNHCILRRPVNRNDRKPVLCSLPETDGLSGKEAGYGNSEQTGITCHTIIDGFIQSTTRVVVDSKKYHDILDLFHTFCSHPSCTHPHPIMFNTERIIHSRMITGDINCPRRLHLADYHCDRYWQRYVTLAIFVNLDNHITVESNRL